MIFGIGGDLVDIRRIEKLAQRFEDRFSNRLLSPSERPPLSPEKQIDPSLLAKRFAAKEACAKAIGTGISRFVSWHDMEICHGTGQRPRIYLSQRVLEWIKDQSGYPDIQLDLSLSDEYPYVQAFVVISFFEKEKTHDPSSRSS